MRITILTPLLLLSIGVIVATVEENHDTTIGLRRTVDSTVPLALPRRLTENDDDRPSVLDLVKELIKFIVGFLRASEESMANDDDTSNSTSATKELNDIITNSGVDLISTDKPQFVQSSTTIGPSDVPSSAPSDIPSSAPSDSPSLSPTFDPVPDGYEKCPNSKAPIHFANMTETTVLFGYKYISSTSSKGKSTSASSRSITKLVEEHIQKFLLETVCSMNGSSIGIFAISPEPYDIASEYCDEADFMKDVSTTKTTTTSNTSKTSSSKASQTTVTESCHLVATRTSVLSVGMSAADQAEMYCKTMYTIEMYMSSGILNNHSIPGIISIESYAASDLKPIFCSSTIYTHPDNVTNAAGMNIIEDLTNNNNNNDTQTIEDKSENNNNQKIISTADATTSIPVGTTAGIVAAGALCVGLTGLYIYFRAHNRSKSSDLLEVPSDAF